MLCISWRKEAPSVLERGRAVYVGKTDDGHHKNSYVAFCQLTTHKRVF